MKKIYLIPAAFLIIIAAVIAGCIMTGTVVITASPVPNADGETVTISDLNYSGAEIEVDLTNDATFKEYRDDIRNIENIGFFLKATNHEVTDTTFQLFLEPDTAKNFDSVWAILVSPADLILTGLVIPGGESVTIDWNESMEYVTNLDKYKEVLEGGVFSLYPASLDRENFNFTIDSLVVIVTLTGKK